MGLLPVWAGPGLHINHMEDDILLIRSLTPDTRHHSEIHFKSIDESDFPTDTTAFIKY